LEWRAGKKRRSAGQLICDLLLVLQAAHSAAIDRDSAYKVLFDIHGRRDYHRKLGNDDSDIDIGLGAMRQRHPQVPYP
jgi:hypothetical protein